MGMTDSKNKDDSTDSKDSEIPPTMLPLNKEVRVHLVPKFYTSEDRGFTRTYGLFVTLKKQKDKDLHSETVKCDRDLIASVEFHEQKLGSFSASQSSSILDRSDFFSPLRRLRSRSQTVHSTDIEVDRVSLNENHSLRITGVFKNNFIDSVDKLISDDTFELILCPSFRINRECSDWSLLGTMYTKPANSKHVRHWKAAVRADFT